MSQQHEVATLGGGCYWCLEACFENLKGVEKCESGFSGGHVENPSYRAVCNGNTGHAEVIQVTFDPTVITFGQLLEVFFAIHNPTTLNRQGGDVGTQYRSAIFYHSPEQKRMAEETIVKLTAEQAWPNPIVTQVVPFEKFYAAEEYHQGYFRANPDQPYCMAVVSPKAAKARQKFAKWWKSV
ncbi:peptide-methionine (S)-S-oxide reductase MsrA [Limnoglobus roseus]|uniref:Peptide methionine sulfoxide reductase MsrA n=1 Tax=Limnoglobus roseus TaxID=2598579 RepID=A0A5C1A2N0_9BACT|nr:peptide-methionine (S)-S-oxide reductase MsrA [Limnoglobus roseus]QEL13379.1 peptide-methionine (S)-S-oxide reductase [Limnoglobus roseus]